MSMGFFDGYGWRWNTLRREAYRRDAWTCQRCGASGVKLYAHHKRHLSQGGANRLENLETVCRRCHEREHPHLHTRRIMFWMKVYAAAALFVLCLIVFFAATR